MEESGGPIRDRRLQVYPCGLFDDIDKFHTFLHKVIELGTYNEHSPQIVELHQGTLISNFTHSDLHPRNIIIDKHGKILSIIDWDCGVSFGTCV